MLNKEEEGEGGDKCEVTEEQQEVSEGNWNSLLTSLSKDKN